MSTALLEVAAAICGVAGTVLLARKGPRAGWGFVAFLASNVGWIAFAWIQAHWALLVQQLAFTVTSVWGIWNWLVQPLFDLYEPRPDASHQPFPIATWRDADDWQHVADVVGQDNFGPHISPLQQLPTGAQLYARKSQTITTD